MSAIDNSYFRLGAAGIDGVSPATSVKLGSTKPSGSFYPERLRVIQTSSTTLVTPPTFSIGTNATAYNNIYPATLGPVLADGKFIDIILSAAAQSAIAAGLGVNLVVSTPATADTYIFAVYLIGDHT